MTRYDVAVVGLGLFGAAALRRLAERGARAVGVGPAEPESWANRDTVFASHYDSGRITRRIDRNPAWADLAIRSILAYGPLESRTGIAFHRPVGTLWAAEAQDRIDEIAAVADRFGIACEFGQTTTEESVRGYRLPGGLSHTFEGAPAGFIDPRRLLDAQLEAARQDGASIVREAAVAREPRASAHRLRTESGATVDADRVILATGAYANAYELTETPLPLRVKTEVTILARVSPGAATHTSLPTLIYSMTHPTLSDLYLVPPTEYPNGATYLKAGADTVTDLTPATRDEMNEWMRSGNSEAHHRDFVRLLAKLLPDLTIEASSMKRCLITYTAHGLPYVDELESGVFVATGGNGRGAKSSDAIGAAAAELALGAWADPLPRDDFRVPRDLHSLPDAVPL